MDIWVIGISETMGLAAVALIGYLFGRRTRTVMVDAERGERDREVERAAQIASRLECIAESLRQSLANHHAQVMQFKRRLRQVRELPSEQLWQMMCEEAEQVLVPTMALASELSQAYDQLRQQSQALATFTSVRVDPLTGVATARALEEQIAFYLRCQQNNRNAFSVAMITTDVAELESQSRAELDRILQNVANLLQRSVRGHDFLARYGSEEFAVLLPNTRLQGANHFAQRIRKLVENQLHLTASVGLSESVCDDDAKSLLGRADSALYSARAAGGNAQFSHTGEAIRPQAEFMVPAASNSAPAPTPKRKKRSAEPQPAERSFDELAEVLVEAGA
jgi:diguanylate cyclase (GGDEF)-like protein